MYCLSYISSSVTFPRSSQVTMRSSFYAFSCIAWRRGISHGGSNVIKLGSLFSGFGIQCFSSRRARASRLPKVKPQPPVEEETNAFYVVRKGDIIGVYKSLSDCQAQVSSSVCDPSVSVYKGLTLHKETEEFLASRGLKDALYTMHATDLKDDLFGKLILCPFQQPDGLAFLVDKASEKITAQKRSNVTMNSVDAIDSSSTFTEQTKKPFKEPIEVQPISTKHMTCILEFDGASKGNPGKSGAGAILRTADGGVIARVREGLGVATNNVAEYKALILGMNYAVKKGFKQIEVQGDSKLVIMQIENLWRTRNANLAELCKEAKQLKQMFQSFKIKHVLREFNAGADAEANLALDLQVGEVYEECRELC